MKTIILILSFTSIFAHSAAKDQKLQQVINKYRNSPSVSMKVDKVVKLKLLGGDPEVSSGSLLLSSSNMRYSIDQPNKHLIVMNADSIWIENRLSEKLGGKIQATHLQTKSSQSKIKGFLAAFFGNKNIADDMSFTAVDKYNFDIEFKKKSQIKDLKSAKIGIDKEGEKIKYIEYTDKFKNVTRHNFSKVKFLKEKDLEKFKYNPPAGAEVTKM